MKLRHKAEPSRADGTPDGAADEARRKGNDDYDLDAAATTRTGEDKPADLSARAAGRRPGQPDPAQGQGAVRRAEAHLQAVLRRTTSPTGPPP